MSPVADQIPTQRLDADEQAWLDHELTKHPEVSLEQALAAVAEVHRLHLMAGCS